MSNAQFPAARVFLIFAAAYFLSYTFRSIGPLIAPELTLELALNPRQLGLLGSAYFFTFFLAQPVVGIAMDRFGPARVNAVLISIAASGSALFAVASDVYTLAAARALIGLGAAGALMTALKAFVVWFEPRNRESLSGAMMAVGGVAAMVAATPAEWLMRVLGWRGLFWLLAAGALMVATTLALATPAFGNASPAAPARAGAGGYRRIFASRIFLSYAPLAIFFSGGFSAIQSLWAGPWLAEVAGLSRAAAAAVLLVYGFSLFCGYLLIAGVGSRINARPGAPRQWYIASLAISVIALACIVSNAWPASSLPWFAYGITLAAGMLAYPALTRAFPVSISGRVLTAYNMLMFMGGFALQSGLGILIQALLDAGWSRVHAYQGAFGSLLVAQFAALIWFVALSREEVR